mmetsp:Transcript_19646/g.54802  ORF Transcript_19646/g.54802 Transcript_19646/m.54802 type:complete len:584 (+) Transcript_19646:357-2108(+)
MDTGDAKRRLIVWLRNDLRLTDNPLLHEAASLCSKAQGQAKYDEVLPVYIFDPRTYAVLKTGDFKTGVYRASFVVQSVRDLKAGLRQTTGSDLLVLVGKPEEVIPGLVHGCQSPLVLSSQEVTSEELKVEAALERALKPVGGKLTRLWSNTLYHMDDLQSAQGPLGARGIKGMPDGFTSFREKVERGARVRQALPAPSKGSLPLPSSASQVQVPSSALLDRSQSSGSGGGGPSLQALLQADPSFASLPWPEGTDPQPPATHPQAVLKFQGGESAALARLKYYLWDSDLLATYFDTRNGMLGGDYSTKFAPWLAAGCISPRTIYHEIKKYEAQRVANKSTYWVIFELIWRDFFRFFAAKHEDRIFYESGPIGKKLPWVNDLKRYERWAQGKTGLPLVDANMRELAATGFMSNRGRQNVASHLVLDLGIDWRRGAFLFESLLLDYDVASNWGNWVAAAGLTGGRINAFNITKQSKDYDLNGDYIRAWVPELKNVPAERIHEPWLMSKDEMRRYGVEIGVDYPAPLPAKEYARLQYAGGGGGGNERGGGYGGRGGGGYGRGGGSNRGRPSSGRGGAKRSQFEMFNK